MATTILTITHGNETVSDLEGIFEPIGLTPGDTAYRTAEFFTQVASGSRHANWTTSVSGETAAYAAGTATVTQASLTSGTAAAVLASSGTYTGADGDLVVTVDGDPITTSLTTSEDDLTKIIAAINTEAGYTLASDSDSELLLTSPTKGSTSSVQVTAGTQATQLGLAATLASGALGTTFTTCGQTFDCVDVAPASSNQFRTQTSDTVAAANLAAALSALVSSNLLTVSPALGVITLTAVAPGAAANLISLATAGGGIVLSGGTLTGGAGGAAATTAHNR